MKLRTAILAGVLALVVAILGATVGAITLVVDRAARRTVEAEVTRSRTLFQELQEYRRSLFRSQARIVADEPRLKAVVATEDVSHETIVGVAADVGQALGMDLLVVTDAAGKLLADVLQPEASGFDMSGNAQVAEALAKGWASGVWLEDGAAYQVEARRMEFGTTPIGVAVVGYEIDDRLAEAARSQTNSTVVVELDGTPIAVSSLEDGRPRAEAAVLQAAALPAFAPAGAAEAGATPREVTLAGDRHLAVAGAFPGYTGARALRFVVLRSLDRALEPGRRLTRIVTVIGGLGLAAAVLIALVLARRLARPVGALVAFTERVGGGQLDARAPGQGPIEVQALGSAMNRMLDDLAASRRKLVDHEVMHKELDIARNIQTAIVPRAPVVDGLDLAAVMLPASEVGGDYYDVQPVPGGCWIGVGDVAGHGLTAGLVMLMVQSAVASLVRGSPDARPADLVETLNRMVYDNVKGRLQTGEHVTFSLLRYFRDGRIVFAGAHQEILVCRASGGACERIPTPGTWLGMLPDVGGYVESSELRLAPGDVMMLYTDGVTEAQDGQGEQFGIDRLAAELERRRADAPDRILAGVKETLAAWSPAFPKLDDDVTLMVIRHVG